LNAEWLSKCNKTGDGGKSGLENPIFRTLRIYDIMSAVPRLYSTSVQLLKLKKTKESGKTDEAIKTNNS
jgi:hypothetical protein